MYTQNPLRGPGKAMWPHPAAAATIRGPRSLAGFRHAWVRGHMQDMTTAIIEPTSDGTEDGWTMW
eukprot:CAMPEP_0185040002 /NCGR_PEP_ID=MMETSP1103-20130426/37538_1 /TAXON_ID=36769 /ORGANISM="Paraphysomonas bandaiensis, Strain Caron Lab Isolate" /LENGTH=64 /DNA_ID=CAMNT_0027579113 /DNA_START=29 /DNA_END=220 /DNA_ORIENTATION=+